MEPAMELHYVAKYQLAKSSRAKRGGTSHLLLSTSDVQKGTRKINK